MGAVRRRRKLGTKAKVALVTALAVGALSVAGAAVTAGGTPPPPTIDLAKADAAAKVAETARAERARAALEAATVPLVFPASGPARVLFAGDSLAEGYFTTAPEKGYRPLVAAKLKESGPIQELGTYRAGAAVQYIVDKFPIPEAVDLAIVELGTNDSRIDGGAPAFTTRYASYLASLKAKSPNMQLICVSTWAPVNTRTIPYNTAISEECAKAGGRYLDLTAHFNITTLRGPEGTPTWGGPADAAHPNDYGHQAIATAILEKIRR